MQKQLPIRRPAPLFPKQLSVEVSVICRYWRTPSIPEATYNSALRNASFKFIIWSPYP